MVQLNMSKSGIQWTCGEPRLLKRYSIKISWNHPGCSSLFHPSTNDLKRTSTPLYIQTNTSDHDITTVYLLYTILTVNQTTLPSRTYVYTWLVERWRTCVQFHPRIVFGNAKASICFGIHFPMATTKMRKIPQNQEKNNKNRLSCHKTKV